MVTRVATDEDVGQQMVTQLFITHVYYC
nr:hypothetical protein [Proteus hauseri]